MFVAISETLIVITRSDGAAKTNYPLIQERCVVSTFPSDAISFGKRLLSNRCERNKLWHGTASSVFGGTNTDGAAYRWRLPLRDSQSKRSTWRVCESHYYRFENMLPKLNDNRHSKLERSESAPRKMTP